MDEYEKRNFEKMKAALEGVELTASEIRTLEWLSGYVKVTIDNMVSIFQKIKASNE